MLKQLRSKRDLALILKDFNVLAMTQDQLKALYDKAISAGLTGFLMIDAMTNDPKLQARNQFWPFDASK